MSRQASAAAYNYYKSANSEERHSILDKKIKKYIKRCKVFQNHTDIYYK